MRHLFKFIQYIKYQWRWFQRKGWTLIDTETIKMEPFIGQHYWEIWRNDETGEIIKVEVDHT